MNILYIFIYIYVPVNFLNGLGTFKKYFFFNMGPSTLFLMGLPLELNITRMKENMHILLIFSESSFQHELPTKGVTHVYLYGML